MIRIAARELTTVVERVLVRAGYPHGVALPVAELLTAGEFDRGGYADSLMELLPELDALTGADSPTLEATGTGVTTLDARGALAAVMGPIVLDALELARDQAVEPRVIVKNMRCPHLLTSVVSAGRERGLAIDVELSDSSAECVLRSRNDAVASTSNARSFVELDRATWDTLVREANAVLAPASAESRLDAGY